MPPMDPLDFAIIWPRPRIPQPARVVSTIGSRIYCDIPTVAPRPGIIRVKVRVKVRVRVRVRVSNGSAETWD